MPFLGGQGSHFVVWASLRCSRFWVQAGPKELEIIVQPLHSMFQLCGGVVLVLVRVKLWRKSALLFA